MVRPIDIIELNEQLVIDEDNSVTDSKGNRWTDTSLETTDGNADSYGPGHPNPPPIIKALREALLS